MNKSLNTVDGQFAAGKFVAKNYWKPHQRERSVGLETRALICRLYNEDFTPRDKEEQKILSDAWEKGIVEGIRIREIEETRRK